MNLNKCLHVGIDIHGVIDAHPKFFARFTKRLQEQGHRVFIITGGQGRPELFEQLTEYDIHYDEFFSITDYHLNNGTEVTFADPLNPWMDAEVWNRTKGDYCRENKIDILIDDTKEYGEWCTDTTFMHVLNKGDKDAK